MIESYDLALIFPCYNEEKRVGKTFAAYYEYLKNNPQFANQRVILVFVDDGSSDNTANVINDFTAKSSPNLIIKAISYPNNQGKGGAIKTGIRTVDAQLYGFIDADLAYGPELLPAMLAELRNNDLVIARRAKQKENNLYRRWRDLVSGSLQRIVNYLVGLPKIDTQRGFKFFNAGVAHEVFLATKENKFAFDIEALSLARHADFKIKPVPVEFTHDKNSTITMKDGFRYLFDILAIADRTRKSVNFSFWLNLTAIYAIFTALLFGWTLFTAYFFSDDFTWLWHGARINLDLGKVLTFQMSSFYSPVLNLFYTVMYQIFGFYAPAYFGFGLLVHLANSLLAALIAWQLSRSRLVTAVTGLLFVWTGGAFEPLVWVGANMHSIATLFIFCGVASYLAYLSSGRKKYLPLSFLAALLAIGSKEIAIVFPLLLIAILFIFWSRYKDKVIARANLIYWAMLGILFLLYGAQQFLWQKQSAAVASGTFSFSWHTIAKLPIVIVDIFVPLSKITVNLHYVGLATTLLLTSLFILAILIIYRWLKLVWFGFAWMIITIAPTIFLATVHWWDPLASRYTYLPRFGMIIVLTAIFHYHVSKNSSRHIISIFAGAVIVIAVLQILFMANVINRDYLYVYNAGRTLYSAMTEIKKDAPSKLYIQWDHPFTSNNAHLVGAAITIADLKEEDIIFPQASEKIKLKPDEILLYWDANVRQYKIKTSAK